MRTRCRVLMLAAAVSYALPGVHPAAAAPAPTTQDAPASAAKPQSPEIRPSSPEDEALKRLIGKRRSGKGITLSSGPIARPHKVLGTVSVEAAPPAGGTDTKPGPNLYLNELLRGEAIKRYGEMNVDGIMSITYTPAAEGKLRASGTAVHFEEQAGGKEKQ
jgi:hypothetical protein